MLETIKYNLSHLTDFSGRDARQTFWLYILMLVVLQFAIGIVAAIPGMIGMMGDVFTAASNGQDPEDMQAAMIIAMPQFLRQTVWISAGGTVLTCALFVASFARRLHDAGYTGWIALVPVATSLTAAWGAIHTLDASMAIMQQALENPERASELSRMENANSYGLLSWVGYIVTIAFGILKSQDGPNRYGEAPVRF